MKKINISDLFEQEDVFKGIRKSAIDTIETLQKVQSELKESAKVIQNDIKNSSTNSAKGLKEFSAAAKAASQVMKDSATIAKQQAQAEQQRIKVDQELIKLEKLKAQELARANKEAEKAAAAAAKIAKETANQNNAYKQLEKSTRDLKNQSKELGAQMLTLEQSGKKNSAEYERLASKYKLVTQAAQQGDAQLKKLDKTVGDNFRNVGNYEKALGGLKNILSQVGVAFGAGAILQSGIKSITEFNQSLADLQSITGASGKDLEFYAKQANELGIQVEGGASAVVEAYKLIGSAKPELLANAESLNAVTKSAITLAQAAGMSVPDAATALTDAMNQFGASAEDADKFINVLAAGSKFGAVEIPQVTEALLKFGAVAKTSGVSIEETGALIEALGERGLKGAEAGTALRNVMLKLSAPDALPKEAITRLTELGINFDTLRDKSIPFTDRLRALQPLLNDNAALVKTFGTENAVAATNLIQLTGRTDELTKQMTGTNTAYDQANQRTNTLSHALTELKNSFTSLFTSVASGDGSMQLIIDTLKWLASNLPTIAKLVFKLGSAWLIYKAGIQAVNAANFVMNGGFQQITKSLAAMIPGTRAARLEQIQLARAQQQVGTTATGAGTAVKGFGQAFKSIAWMALIATLAELAVGWYNIASGIAETRRQQDMFNRAKENADKKAQELQGKTQSGIDETLRKLDLELRTRKAKGESEAKLEAERAQRTKQIIADARTQYNLSIGEAKYESDRLYRRKKSLEQDIKLIKSNAGLKKELEQITEQYNTVTLTYNNLVKGQKSFNDQLEEAAVKTIEATTTTEDYGVKVEDNTHKIKANTKALQENVDLTREIQDEQVKAIQDEGQRAQTELIIQAQRRIEDIQKTVADKNQKATLIKQIEANLIAALDKMDSEWYEKSLEAQKQADANKLKAKNEFLDKIEEITEENTRRTMSEQEVEERNVNDKYFALEEAAKDDAEALAQIEIAKMNELNDIRLKYQNIEYDNKKEADQKLIDADKKKNEEMWQTTQEFAQKTTDYFKKKSDERIVQIEKEISAAEKQADYYRELAANGNINAQQSLAEQERIIAESNRRKEREQKRQQRMELANTIYQTYAGHAAKDPDTALMKTIKDASLLQAFISTLPMFYDGTEDTGSGGGVDGKGGFHAVLHPHERVIPKSLNDQIGNLTNEQLTNLAMQYQNGKLVGKDVAHSSLDLAVLVNKLDNLTEVIKHKPETNIELGEITQSAMEIVKSTRKGNTTVYNRFKVRS